MLKFIAEDSIELLMILSDTMKLRSERPDIFIAIDGGKEASQERLYIAGRKPADHGADAQEAAGANGTGGGHRGLYQDTQPPAYVRQSPCHVRG